MRKEYEVLDDFLHSKGLRHTHQRKKIVDIFLSTEKHVSLDDLFKLVHKEDRTIGYTTVYRTMRLLTDCGLSNEIDFGDGVSRFEHKFGHEHHDHLVCMKCGRFIEVVKQKIEDLQGRLAKEHGFLPTAHRLHIFGICKRCQSRGASSKG
ncbi:MAG: transcriptional repressor [Omnitrophica bacterium RIFCSPLOWO2_01_FULL_45_10]|nr:MAG: transcriptional repressor [Omnitrophica bacterium RIFCSPLOWO2_01_FULL_45_10]